VFVRSLELTDNMRCRGLHVLADSAEARDLCLHLVPELEASPTDELHIVLLMRDIRRTWTAKTPPCCLRETRQAAGGSGARAGRRNRNGA
jgi:hypothetical protein